MTDFHRHVTDYLQLRRSLGFRPGLCARVLPQLASYLEASGAPVLTAQLAISWAGLPEGVQPIVLAHRLGSARGLARYLQAIDPATEIPPVGIWSATAHRPTPYLWSPDDICRLLEAARGLRPLLRAQTYETLFGLLACSGLRLGGALSLRREDADLGAGALTIREAKFDRSRLVPLHPSTTEALRTYASRRDTLCHRPRPAAFFASSAGTAPSDRQVHHTFAQLTSALGLRNATTRPRIHDFRHSFAVRTLINWHRAGVDTGAHMAVLSDDWLLMVSGTREHAQQMREHAAAVLAPMGLRLSPDKTLITHIDKGLDFLGWHIQRHRKRGTSRYYVYTYPSRKAVKAVTAKVKAIFRRNVNQPLQTLIRQLNPALRGWCAYFRPGVSAATFADLARYTLGRFLRWARRKHRRITIKSIRRRYCNSGWWPVTTEIALFNPDKMRTTRYRYRGAAIPAPWPARR